MRPPDARLLDELRAAHRAARAVFATAGERRQEAWDAHRATGEADRGTLAAYNLAEEIETHAAAALRSCATALRLLGHVPGAGS